jgi:hypothetical protein
VTGVVIVGSSYGCSREIAARIRENPAGVTDFGNLGKRSKPLGLEISGFETRKKILAVTSR